MKLIDKDAIVAEIERRIKEGEKVIKCVPSSAIIGLVQAYENTLSFLDTLEVKEVDLEKEWKEYFKYRGDVATVNLKHLARHFFELGLNAQKGE